ncbi:MAG TPA: 16S rRNA (cytosine(1402)-N(4))-methyltransferase RsmH [Pirellulales bacterium]|nr:16S rRNA (cytosine(1402)-N(4))-methyltransferase RsmH [Pirellulales bacterium]
MDSSLPIHVSVMLEEVIQHLDPGPGQIVVDGTLGGGGHTRALAERVGPAGLVVALDRDPAALAAAERNLAGMPVKLVSANFRELPQVLQQLDISEVDGILLDLGLSSDQLADTERGFSFDSTGPLDLRFDPDQGEAAWRLLERLNATQLADLFYTYGEERFSRRIARNIIERRAHEPIRTARQLADLVRRSVPRNRDAQRIDPATRTFQALRIAVNDELESLEVALKNFAKCLVLGGRVAVISFHSLEDRIVKEIFRDEPRYEALTKRPLRPTEAETKRNPRSRSAKMRVARRIL